MRALREREVESDDVTMRLPLIESVSDWLSADAVFVPVRDCVFVFFDNVGVIAGTFVKATTAKSTMPHERSIELSTYRTTYFYYDGCLLLTQMQTKSLDCSLETRQQESFLECVVEEFRKDFTWFCYAEAALAAVCEFAE